VHGVEGIKETATKNTSCCLVKMPLTAIAYIKLQYYCCCTWARNVSFPMRDGYESRGSFNMDEVDGICSTHERKRNDRKFICKILRRINSLRDLGTHGDIILKETV
jgi:hypothetical protein